MSNAEENNINNATKVNIEFMNIPITANTIIKIAQIIKIAFIFSVIFKI